MLYWIIPFLAAYNLPESSPYWKNGLVHTFGAEVNVKAVKDSEADFYCDATMLFECRTTNSSFMKCQVLNATLDNYEMENNNKTPAGKDTSEFPEEFRGIDFHIEFDKIGIKNLTFPKPRGYYREMVIRAIFDNLNVGINLTNTNFNGVGKCVFGECPTSFNFKKVASPVGNTVKANVPFKESMIFPLFENFPDNETFFIEKIRKMSKCLNKKPYIFGSDELVLGTRKSSLILESDIIRSRSEIFLDQEGFNTFSEHSGTYKMGIKSENSKYPSSRMKMGKTTERIRLSLISIRPDKTE